ncbi:hypothetical protein RCL1_005753 [Eukaryota sp. TZLM3-RCL]
MSSFGQFKSSLQGNGVSDAYLAILLEEGIASLEDLVLVITENCLPQGKAIDMAKTRSFARTHSHSTSTSNPSSSLNLSQQLNQSLSHSSSAEKRINSVSNSNKSSSSTNIIKSSQSVKAAGILPCYYDGNDVFLLLGHEFRLDHFIRGCLNILGGGLNLHEEPKEGAIRELLEETSLKDSFQHGETLARELRQATLPSVYIREGKYMLFFLQLDLLPINLQRLLLTLPKNFVPNFEVRKVFWVSLKELQQSTIKKYPISDFLGKCKPYINSYVEAQKTSFAPLELLSSINPQAECKEAFEQLFRQQVDLCSEIARRSSIIDHFLPKNWRLNHFGLDLLQPAELSPIATIQRESKQFSSLIQKIPASYQSAINVIRKVNVVVRRQTFDNQLKAFPGSNPLIVFHGTPESWRATAIALNGFDLSIRLNGRALGDGVYSSTDANTAFGYTRSQGSVLLCDAFEAPGRKNVTPQSQPPVYVFTNKDHILPVTIYDFSADPNGSPAPLVSEEEKARKEFDRLQKQLKQDEKNYMVLLKQRYSSLLSNYKARLESLNVLFTRHSKDQESILTLLKNETGYFKQALPIYHYKQDIMDALKENTMLLIQCDTGSGKSTNLCQYLSDFYLEQGILLDNNSSDDVRKIAVLQPRRDNAIQISRRVAVERGVVLGEEVGYTIGLGVSQVNEDTRIEFLTHGKFEQIASNISSVLRQYKAVVVDEAHFRSVQIDFVLSLLKQIISEAAKHNVADFKVIITTATFDSEFLDTLKDYYSPVTKVQCLSFSVPSFPVMEQFVDVFNDNYNEAITAFSFDYFSNAIINAAIEMSIMLLQQTDTGSILVFLPSKNSIDRALSVFSSKYMTFSDASESSSGSFFSASSFRFRLEQNKKHVTIGVYAFHGKLTRTERNQALQAKEDRCIYFSTDLAETGLTINNVRYVVDSGFNQVVRWNPKENVQEMSRELISKSSAIQRKGRAGRTHSGICIRLYPKSLFEKMPEKIEPEIRTGFVLKSVLSLLKRRSTNPDFDLVESLDTSLYDHSVDLLSKVDVLDTTAQPPTVTEVGELVLRLGVDFDHALFLINAHKYKCLDSAAKVCALMSTSADNLFTNMSILANKFLHSRGEHATLLRIFNAFLDSKSEDRLSWCMRMGFDRDLLEDTLLAYEHLVSTLDSMGFSVEDELDEEKGDVFDHIVLSLCSSFFNNFAAFRAPGSLGDRFILLSDADVGNPDSIDLSGDNANILSLSNDVLKAFKDCSLQSDVKFVVFSSRMANVYIDPEENKQVARNVISFVSFCTSDDLLKSSPSWRVEMLEKQIQHAEHVKFSVPLSSAQQTLLLQHMGARSKNLQGLVRKASFRVDKLTSSLNITCPRHLETHVRRRVLEFLDSHNPEVIKFSNLNNINFKELIGRGGFRLNDLRARIADVVKSATSNPTAPKVEVDSSTKSVTITIPKIPHEFASVILGLVQSALAESCSNVGKANFSNFTASASFKQHIHQNQRLAKLVSSVVPRPSSKSRDDWVLLIAHTAIWSTGLRLYGGFVRDYVIRNQSASDVDTLYSSTLNGQSVASSLASSLGSLGLRCGQIRQKGAALCLPVALPDGSTCDVDFTPDNFRAAPPFVDCDVNNLCVDKTGLQQKIKGAGGVLCDLAQSIKHCSAKEFVFFYQVSANRDMCLTRLTKMLGKGFTCKSPLDADVVNYLARFSSLLKPDAKFNVPFHNLPPNL